MNVTLHGDKPALVAVGGAQFLDLSVIDAIAGAAIAAIRMVFRLPVPAGSSFARGADWSSCRRGVTQGSTARRPHQKRSGAEHLGGDEPLYQLAPPAGGLVLGRVSGHGDSDMVGSGL